MTTPTPVFLTYNGLISQIANLAVLQVTTVGGVVTPIDADLTTLLPQMINTAELRIQRDLDLEQSVTNDSSLALTSGNNILTMDVNAFITVQSISYVAGTTTNRMLPASRAFIDEVYNDSSFTGPPIYFAPYGGDATTTGATSQYFLFGPTPDQNYPLSINGTVRMISLNSFNTSPNAGTQYTFISAYLPDLLLMSCMQYISAFQRNWGKMSDDPAMAMSYEAAYQGLLKGAMVEEARRKMWASAWTSLSIPAVATSTR